MYSSTTNLRTSENYHLFPPQTNWWSSAQRFSACSSLDIGPNILGWLFFCLLDLRQRPPVRIQTFLGVRVWKYKHRNAPVHLIRFLFPCRCPTASRLNQISPSSHLRLQDVGCLCLVSGNGCSFAFIYAASVSITPPVSHSSRWHITSLSSFCQAAKSSPHRFRGPTAEWETLTHSLQNPQQTATRAHSFWSIPLPLNISKSSGSKIPPLARWRKLIHPVSSIVISLRPSVNGGKREGGKKLWLYKKASQTGLRSRD